MDKVICVFGDSIAHGFYDWEVGGWVDRLKLSLKAELYNSSISGDTTSDLLKRFKVESEARKPDIIIFAIGVNDSIFRKTDMEQTDTPAEIFKSNIRKLIELAKGFTNDVLFLGLGLVEEAKVQPFPWSSSGKCYSNRNIELFDGYIKKICDQEEVPYLNTFNIVKAEDLEDGIHPTSEGHRRIYEEVKAKLVSLGSIEPKS